LEEAEIASAKLNNVLTSMGFEDSVKRVDAYAESLQNLTAVDADVIKATQTKLATFANLTKTVDTAGGAFDRATVAALDLAAAGFGSAETNAVQLGKALEDPIKGITALARSGVTFTAQEKEKIKVLVESGELLEAQNMVLGAIEKQVGGTAAASASSFDKIKLALDGVADAIGTGVLPLIEQLTPKLQAFSAWAAENSKLLSTVVLVVGALTGALYTLSLIIKAVTIVQTVFNAVMLLNPIGLVVLAVAALAAGFVLAYKKIEPFRDLVNSIFQAIKNVGSAIAASKFATVLGGLIGRLPGMAAGGSVMAGQAVRVGEFGSEVFIPSGSGSIRPDRGNGGGNTFILNGIVDAESARRTIERVMQNSTLRTGAVNLAGSPL
jgi:phage-related protein